MAVQRPAGRKQVIRSRQIFGTKYKAMERKTSKASLLPCGGLAAITFASILAWASIILSIMVIFLRKRNDAVTAAIMEDEEAQTMFLHELITSSP